MIGRDSASTRVGVETCVTITLTDPVVIALVVAGLAYLLGRKSGIGPSTTPPSPPPMVVILSPPSPPTATRRDQIGDRGHEPPVRQTSQRSVDGVDR